MANIIQRIVLRARRRSLGIRQTTMGSGMAPIAFEPSQQADNIFAVKQMGEPQAQAQSEALRAQREKVEDQLGMEPEGGRAGQTGPDLQQAIDEHAESLRRWREEDERQGRKRS